MANLDAIAFRVVKINRRGVAMRPPARPRPLIHSDAMGFEMRADGLFVERLDAETEVIKVSPFRARGGAAGPAEFTIDRHQIQKRLAGAQLYQANRVPAALDGATEDAAVKMEHTVKVDHPQYEVINVA